MQLDRDAVDVVEQDRAVLGALEEPRARGQGVGLSLGQAEQLLLELLAREGGAVQRNEGPTGATGEVQDARHELLAGTRLADQEGTGPSASIARRSSSRRVNVAGEVPTRALGR